MPTYRKRPQPVEAEQWQPGMVLAGVEMRTDYRILGGEQLTQMPPGPSIQTLAGWHRLKPGDWIVTNPDGTRVVFSDDYFRLEYEPAPPEG